MSNLLKSKSLLGMTVLAVIVAGALFAFATIQTADAYTQMGTLKMGSTGSQVMALQQALNGAGNLVATLGAGSPGMESTFFGAKTKTAVMAYQSAKGLTADGVVGPATGAMLGGVMTGGGSGGALCPNGMTLASNCATPPAGAGGTLCPNGNLLSNNCAAAGGGTGPLTGGAGSIVITASGAYSSENVGEGKDDVNVMAVEIEADNGSDVQLQSTKVEFIQGTAGDPKQLWKYASEVSVWFEGEKVGSADPDDFSKSGNYYSATIPLDGVVLRAGEKKELVFAVSALSSLESTDIDTDAWTADLINVRFEDANGVVISESADAAATAAGTFSQTFDFDTFATATGATLTLTLEDKAVNDIHLLDVDDVLDTSHPITSVQMYASGSDVWVDDMVSTITTTGETDESVIVISSWIEVNGVRISDKEDVVVGGAVTYDLIDRTIPAGAREEWIFWVEMQDVNGALDDGDTVQLTVTTASTTAQDGSGDTLTAAGSNPVGGVHLMYDNGIRLTGSTQTATAFTVDGVNNDRVELTLNFDVFNFGDTTLYIPDGDTLTGTASTSATTTAPSTTEKVGYHIQSAGTVTPGTNDISAVLSESDTDLVTGTNAYRLDSGKTGTFSLKVTVATDANPSIDNVAFRALLAGLGWATSDTATAAVVYTANLTDYKTDYATLAD
ncbi:MAG: peptidoglycan-binding domain-containing protein [bacterium]|nr:peptidoglycan-binding domain-containing protein [bacterium]